MNIEEARKLLYMAGIFFDDLDDEVDEDELTDWGVPKQILNMNDVWAWAMADGEQVTDEELPELVKLFKNYGWCGVLYWVSEKRGGIKSEFLDNNRFIEFVRNEERIRKEIPDCDKRAYARFTYTIGEV